jgi:DNA primase
MKDVMVLRELGYNAIAFNSEGIPTKGENGKFVAETIEHLKSRFEHVILFLDNDAPGKEYTKKISTKYNLKSILIPDNEPKDISDYIAKYGRRKTKRMLNKQLKKLLTKETTTNELNVPY